MLVGTAVAWIVSACGTSNPPQELVDARRAFAEAERSSGAEVAPVELEEARDALDRAEAYFGDDADSEETRDYSYIAERKALRAHARGAAELARREADARHREAEELEAEYLRSAQRALSATRDQLEEERRRSAASSEELSRERSARERAEQEAAAALASLREIAQVQEEQRGLVITLSGAVLFRSGSSELLPIARQKLDQVAVTLNEHDGRTILVEGHTDSRGTESSNLRLSQNRADSVRTYLVSRSIESSRIRAEGRGELRPIADNSTAEGRANNRRVEIVVEPLR